MLIAAAMATSIAFGQRKPEANVKALTVCEVMGDFSRYADRVVALVGRMERSVSLIDHYEFLSQDRCEHPIITHGHKFRNRIQIWTDWEEGMPKPPTETPKLDVAQVAAKLSAIRKTTSLGSHGEPGIDGSRRVVPNEWALVYGRIIKLPRFDEDCGSEGCGGDDVPLAIIAESHQVRRLQGDGTLLPDHQ